MLSESTARLVEHIAAAGRTRSGCASRVPMNRCARGGWWRSARGMACVGRAEAGLVGRRWEMAALDAMVDRAIGGRGGVVNVVGPPGIGKSRAAREAAALAASRGVEVVWAFCESHASDIPFHAVARLLRAGSGMADLDGEHARARVAGVRARCRPAGSAAAGRPAGHRRPRCAAARRSTRMRGGAG